MRRFFALLLCCALFPCAAQAASLQHCARTVSPIDYGLQLWDLGNTQRGFRRGLIEVDPLVAPFTGPAHNDIRGEIAEGAVFDLGMLYLTRRSPALRCAWQAIDAISHLSAIFFTNGWRVQTRLFTVKL